MSQLPPTSPCVPYSQVRSQLGTGDLFFPHGTSQVPLATLGDVWDRPTGSGVPCPPATPP